MSVFRDKKYRRLFYTFNKKDKHFKLLNKRFFLLINCNSKLKKKYLLKKLKRVKFFCFLNMLCLFKKFFEYRSFRANNFKLLDRKSTRLNSSHSCASRMSSSD